MPALEIAARTVPQGFEPWLPTLEAGPMTTRVLLPSPRISDLMLKLQKSNPTSLVCLQSGEWDMQKGRCIR